MDTIHEKTTVVHDRDDPPRRPAAPYAPRRRRWPGVLAAAIIGAAIAAAVVSSWYDERTIGQRIDAGVNATQQAVEQRVGAPVGEAIGDAGITASVKTALAADPALSALKIDVSTRDGVVTLIGPAPDEKARERAAVLAAAPQGVQRVDNQLVVGMN